MNAISQEQRRGLVCDLGAAGPQRSSQHDRMFTVRQLTNHHCARETRFKDVDEYYHANIPLSFNYMFYPSTIISPNTINIINSPVLVLFNMFIVVFFTASSNHLLETENWGSVVFNIIK